MRPDRKEHDGGDSDHAKPKGLGKKRESQVACLEFGTFMRISDLEVQKLLTETRPIEDRELHSVDVDTTEQDAQLVKNLTQEILAMPDRDAYVAELRAKIESGQYHPTGDEIAEAMIRRSIADRIR
jgi:negative regulator of flagellin synthesis FlgM